MRDSVSTPRLLVAGLSSGSGKATVAMGLVAALTRRGRRVQSFKVGPDVVYCAYLSRASGRPCRNLDSWLLGDEGVQRSFNAAVNPDDTAIIVGTAGLFDGHGLPTDRNHPFPGSTAEVGRLVGAPVILVLDASTMAETAAAAALGIKEIDPDLRLVGVILNNVPNAHRRQTVEDAIWRHARLPVLGAIPHTAAVELPTTPEGSLVPVTEGGSTDALMDGLAAAVEHHCDVSLIERLASAAPPVSLPRPLSGSARPSSPVRVGVAFDEAFSFYYSENLELLEAAGAEIVPFSPLDDRALPAGLHALYLGGGLREGHVDALSKNTSLLDGLRRVHEQGIPIYAECGGAVLCARSMQTTDGLVHPMAGLLPADLASTGNEVQAGYRNVRVVRDTPIAAAGTTLRGYEFHFTRVIDGGTGMEPAYTMHDADDEPLGAEGWATGSLLASLVHLHFGQGADLGERFARTARAAARQRRALAGAL